MTDTYTYVSAIRRYRLVVNVPPLGEPDEYGARVRQSPYEYVVRDSGYAAPRFVGYTWTTTHRVLDAYDMNEAIQRLEIQLLREGYRKPGQPDHAVYELLDVEPVS